MKATLQETLEFLQREEPKYKFHIGDKGIFKIDIATSWVTQQYIEAACMRWLIDNKFKPTNQRYISGVLHIENLTVNDYFRYSEDLSIYSIIKLADEMNKG